jgi:hypothetical protein
VNPDASITAFWHAQPRPWTRDYVRADPLAAKFLSKDRRGRYFDTGRHRYLRLALGGGGSALHVAGRKIVEKGRKIAAHLLEAADADIASKRASSASPGPTAR